MKIIDLLNRIANGEEVPKKIKIKDEIWTYVDDIDYKASDDRGYLFEVRTRLSEEDLNEELEVIEEDKKDKEIEIYVNGEKVDITDIYEPLKQGEYFYKENGKWYVHKLKNVSFVIEEDKKIEKLSILTFSDLIDMPKEELVDVIKEQRFKINEIINVINKGD